MEREAYLVYKATEKKQKQNHTYHRKRAIIDQIVRYTSQGWTQTMVAERLHVSQAWVSKLVQTRTYETAYRRFSERLDQKVMESLIDIPSEAELALQRIVKRASGVPVTVRKEITVVDGVEQETVVEEAASLQVRQRDDHFLTELHYAKKRQGGVESGNPYLVDPKTATALQSMAETMQALSTMAAQRQAVLTPEPPALPDETPQTPPVLDGIWTATPKVTMSVEYGGD